MRTTLVFFCLLTTLACEDGDGEPDGSVDASDGGGSVVSPPEIPWIDGVPVDLTPCRSGWREVEVHGHVECDAYPEGGRRECEAGEAHFPGEPDCRPVGDACPAGRFADSLPSDGNVIYVDAAAASPGDGSAASPFSSLSSVSWTSLGVGDAVALSKGTPVRCRSGEA